MKSLKKDLKRERETERGEKIIVNLLRVALPFTQTIYARLPQPIALLFPKKSAVFISKVIKEFSLFYPLQNYPLGYRLHYLQPRLKVAIIDLSTGCRRRELFAT